MQEHCKSVLFIVGFCTVVTRMFFLHSSLVFYRIYFLLAQLEKKKKSSGGQIAVVEVQISQL